jgi:PTS system nitrogen regulatory IIA component
MRISELLSSADVISDVVVADKQKLLEELARRAAALIDEQPELILSELIKREQLGSTGIGGGIAIPHARFHKVAKPFAIFVRLKKPIDFDAVDDQPVDTVVLLLLPDAPTGERLGALACIARKLREPATMLAVRRARNGGEIHDIVTSD